MSPSNEPGSAPLPDAPIKTAGAGSKGLTRDAGWPPPRGKGLEASPLSLAGFSAA